MKKTIFLIIAIIASLMSFAQTIPTKFLGLPVDGTKTQMIKNLEAKGFSYNPSLDNLEGEFNGEPVYILITTNRNKVWRICVVDRNPTTESNIKTRYNRLVEQFFNKTDSYESFLSEDKCIIPDDENISFEMSIHNKEYQTPLYQKPTKEEEQQAKNIFAKEQGNDNFDNLSQAKKEDYYKKYFYCYFKRSVWFTIRRDYGDYRIVIYYDNENNHANGEDL